MTYVENPEALQRQLRRLTAAVWVCAVGLALMSVALWFTIFQIFQSHQQIESLTSRSPVADPTQTALCTDDAFYKQTSALMERAKYKDVISASDARLKDCPSDHYAWWWKSKALAIEERWDEALETLRRTELLRPDWRRPYVEPLRESIEWNKARKK